MDISKIRSKKPDEEDLDESFTPKVLIFDSADESINEDGGENAGEDDEILEVTVRIPLKKMTSLPTKKRKMDVALSPNFLTGLDLGGPPRKRLSTLDGNTVHSARRLGTTPGMTKPPPAVMKPPPKSLSSPLNADGTPFCVIRKKTQTGDGSTTLLLPTVRGAHSDLKCISPATLIDVLRQKKPYDVAEVSVVDCRYPFEYQAGHIQGAINIYTPDDLKARFLNLSVENPVEKKARKIIIFHCEFSSERGPDLYRILRNEDRILNEKRYPALHYPELYLLHGGYKAFFEQFRTYCFPQVYMPMNTPGHEDDVSQCKRKAKLQGCGRGGTVAKTAVSRRF
ncbi:putative M-phase inducer phosphatase 3 [Hypsibius exemplaris]|uniref:M-phase inducer phosphatase n=1 Tax=Hypsibius exemplaris TaxID=2072580 RepID=A0A1W0WV49_HYPEX|nr:putative M-phase inducer phosphatase 3 [Hypsibius exemplaris]